MIRKPRSRLAAVGPSGDDAEVRSDTLSEEMWRRLNVIGERYRQEEIGMWEVMAAVSDFVKASGDTAKALQFMSTLPRRPIW